MSTLFWSPTSPYVRKVVLALRELGLERTVAMPHGEANPTLSATSHDINPSGKIPTLVLETGRPIFGSQVILQYLDSQAPIGKNLLPPTSDPARIDELTLESLADGLLDAALLIRYETTMRPEALRWKEWKEGQESKMKRAISQLCERVDPSSKLYQLPSPTSPVLSIGGIAVASACWYLDLRFPEMKWREGKGSNLAEWYSSVQKRPNWSETN